MEIILIAAVSQNKVIGLKGSIPWHSKEEIRHFKETTTGFPIIMGRKTWYSLGKPLVNRINIIVTKNRELESNNTIIVYSLEEALEYCRNSFFKKVYIIGGGEIFNISLDIADKLIISRMNFETDGDVFFPEINTEIWKEISNKKYTDFTVHYYIRE